MARRGQKGRDDPVTHGEQQDRKAASFSVDRRTERHHRTALDQAAS